MNRSDPHLPPATDGVDRLNRGDLGMGDVAVVHWDDLFNAVKDRLRRMVGDGLASGGGDASARLRAGVLECAGALDQLHATLVHEVSRRHQLESEMLDSQSALARTQADLAEARAQEERARLRALHDGLTRLPNSVFFRDRLDQALAGDTPQRNAVAVLYIDLDGLKPINDAHGHDAGDELLRIVAKRLTQAVRADDMVGRLGGDEFACLLLNMPNREHLSRLACKLLDTISAPMKIGQIEISVRPSIGIALCAGEPTSPGTLLSNADAAMYDAKQRKCGYAFFDEQAGRVGLDPPPALQLPQALAAQGSAVRL